MDRKLEPMSFADEASPRIASGRRRLLITFSTILTIFFILGAATFLYSGHPLPASLISAPDPSLQVYNETLGFGEIILISLLERSDRRDGVSLVGSQYNISVTKVINAVHGEEIAEKALPFGRAKTGLSMSHIGSWRSHMDAFKYIIDNHIESALVLEDDVDWDVELKDELYALSLAMRSSTIRRPLSAHELTSAPYGLDWDILHLGVSLAETAPAPFDSIGVRYYDPYRHPSSDPFNNPKWYNWAAIMASTNNSKAPDHRVVIPTYNALGLVAIGVTYEGARRLMYELNWAGLLSPGVDIGIADKSMAGKFQGWTVIPPLMSSWKVGGLTDSDLGAAKESGVDRSNADGFSGGLLHSARKALEESFGDRDGGWELERFFGPWD